MKWNEKFSPSVTLVWFQVLWLVTVILDSAEHFHLKENSIVLNPYYSKGRPAASACESLFVFFFVFFFWLYHVTCGISVPWPGIKLMPPTVEMQSLNHWTTREIQVEHVFICWAFSLTVIGLFRNPWKLDLWVIWSPMNVVFWLVWSFQLIFSKLIFLFFKKIN